MTTRESTAQEKEVFSYLNELRKSGTTNMYGASVYVEGEFGLSSKESKELVVLWMENFNDKGNYEIITIK